jgi:hypothetical protein
LEERDDTVGAVFAGGEGVDGFAVHLFAFGEGYARHAAYIAVYLLTDGNNVEVIYVYAYPLQGCFVDVHGERYFSVSYGVGHLPIVAACGHYF